MGHTLSSKDQKAVQKGSYEWMRLERVKGLSKDAIYDNFISAFVNIHVLFMYHFYFDYISFCITPFAL